MEAIISIIRSTSTKLEEDVKWGGPSFHYKEPMAAFNPRIVDYIVMIFHKGELLNDQTGLLEPASKGKAYAKFYSMDDVKKHRDNPQKVINDWINLMDK